MRARSFLLLTSLLASLALPATVGAAPKSPGGTTTTTAPVQGTTTTTTTVTTRQLDGRTPYAILTLTYADGTASATEDNRFYSTPVGFENASSVGTCRGIAKPFRMGNATTYQDFRMTNCIEYNSLRPGMLRVYTCVQLISPQVFAYVAGGGATLYADGSAIGSGQARLANGCYGIDWTSIPRSHTVNFAGNGFADRGTQPIGSGVVKVHGGFRLR